MAIVQLQNMIVGELRTAVFFKWNWNSQWQYLPYIQPLTAISPAAPAMGTATFKLRYGEGFWEDYSDFVNGDFIGSFQYAYIQIRGWTANYEKILWTGIIPEEEFKLIGRSGLNMSAEQIIKAYSLDWLLETRLEGAWAEPTLDAEPVWINYLPIFNQRHERGGNIIGNKSNYNSSLGCYTFGHNGNIWTYYDIIVNLLKVYQKSNIPKFYLGGNSDIITTLNSFISIIDLSNLTIRGALNLLINSNRGLGWTHTIDYNGNLVIIPYSLLDETIKIGDITIPANKNQISVNLWDNQKMHIDIDSDMNQKFDRIVVKGEKMKTCFNVAYDLYNCEDGWISDEETAYAEAAKYTDGYGDLEDEEKQKLNDSYRSTEKFERVWSAFRVPPYFDWTVNGLYCCPKLNDYGQFINEGANYFNLDKRIENYLPFLVGYDYSGAEPVNNNPDNSEPEFRKLFVAVLDKDSKYQAAHDFKVVDEDDEIQSYGADIRPLAREFGFVCRFRPAYLFAKGYFGAAEPGVHTEDLDDIGLDCALLMATVFAETDQVIQMAYNIAGFENIRIKTIYVPGAEIWYVVPGTYIDINDAGELVTYGGNPVIKDDRDRLLQVLTAAVSWYSKIRNRLNITIRGIDAGLAIGTIVNNTDICGIGAAGSVVTSVSYNFERPVTTIIRTDFAELNLELLAKGI